MVSEFQPKSRQKAQNKYDSELIFHC